ncbi:MAG TPA: ABC transporter ATP-binding protein [Methylomirabilota bacterium]|nr:ABC transporter ATP-binding protein [Methylomirabilota bacterium]
MSDASPIRDDRRQEAAVYPRLVDVTAHPGSVIRLDGVSKVFHCRGREGVAAVADLSLSITRGSAVLLTGPSGSGKTTLLSLVGCMVRPTSGRIVVDGRDVTRLSEDRLAELRRRWIGFVFQTHHLIHGASALDNVMLPALPIPEVNGDLRDRARALLGRFGLAGRASERVERLSGGEQQRVAIARALVNDPEVVIADEPTAHLDSAAARGILDLVDRMRGEGRTVLVASHDPVLCGSGRFDRVVRLHDGRLEAGPERP